MYSGEWQDDCHSDSAGGEVCAALTIRDGIAVSVQSSRVFEQDQLKSYFEEVDTRVIRPKTFVANIL
jgi:hypothetical protein